MITIVIPLFNAEKYISRAIKSCLLQDEVSQIIIVDDKSTDGSVRVVENILENTLHNNICLLKNEKNQGPGISRNIGMDHVTTEYLAFLDADDNYLDDRFERSLSMLENDQAIDGVYTPLMLQNSTVEESYELEKNNGEHISFEDMLLRAKGRVTHTGILFRRSFIENNMIRYGDTYWGEDTEMLFQVTQKGNVVYLDDLKTVRNITGDNLSLNLDISQQYNFHKKWFKNMLKEDYSRDVNYYFLKNLIRKHPIFHNRHSPKYRLPKFMWLVAKIITTPRLWSKLL